MSLPMTTRDHHFHEHMPQVESIASSIYKKLPKTASVNREDLIHTGAVGLLEAIKHYDPERN